MKTTSLILGLGIFLVCLSTWAQDGLSELDGDLTQNIENEALNISGNIHEKKPEVKKETEADRFRKYREQLEKQHEEQVKVKMQQQRIQAEIQMMKKMQKAFDEQMKKLDQK